MDQLNIRQWQRFDCVMVLLFVLCGSLACWPIINVLYSSQLPQNIPEWQELGKELLPWMRISLVVWMFGTLGFAIIKKMIVKKRAEKVLHDQDPVLSKLVMSCYNSKPGIGLLFKKSPAGVFLVEGKNIVFQPLFFKFTSVSFSENVRVEWSGRGFGRLPCMLLSDNGQYHSFTTTYSNDHIESRNLYEEVKAFMEKNARTKNT